MKPLAMICLAALLAGTADRVKGTTQPNDAVWTTAARGAKWLVSVQGKDGGWGQDGGETSYVRSGERLESNANDVANTAVAVLALLHMGNTPEKGEYKVAVARGVQFILRNVEDSPREGLSITQVNGTQIQRKLGPNIDTFLTSQLLAELDGKLNDPQANARVRRGLEKCVSKIQTNQQKDGSWNAGGGWAPIVGTSLASRTLYMAKEKGVAVDTKAMRRVDDYTVQSTKRQAAAGYAAPASDAAAAGSAGVNLYQGAQALEQLSRTSADRAKNKEEIHAITSELANTRFTGGFGSIGGEEFFSYLNISDSLHRTGGEEWTNWNGRIKTQIMNLQNEDGTWSGHHCITGRVAVTGAAILTMLVDREPVR